MKRIAGLALGTLLLSLFVFSTGSQSVVAQSPEAAPDNVKELVIGGGCFWCVESEYEKLDGVIDVVSGYSGGTRANPTYKQVSRGETRHIEVVRITYDSSQISLVDLIDRYWMIIDPTDGEGSFVDRGPHYRPVIFFDSDEEQRIIQNEVDVMRQSGFYQKPLQVELLPLTAFYVAEEYHQDYYKKNPIRYKYYRSRSGRDQYIERKWGDLTTADIKARVEGAN